MIMNEKIKAMEVQLTGVDGEDLGIVATSVALELARKLKVDLVCTSLMSSPPLCRLIGAGAAKQAVQQAARKERKRGQAPKLKEIRLTPQIEDHDYETKLQQAQRILAAGDAVLLVVRIQGKEGALAKSLLERLLVDLQTSGLRKTAIQMSGKQAVVQIDPL
jgi:translation initiation factor IF-3